MTEEQKMALKDIKIVVTDIDGVHTDDTVVIGSLGGEISLSSNAEPIRIIACSEDGTPKPESLHYFAPRVSGTVMEGYRFFTGDGIAIKECLRHDIPVVMVSGRVSPAALQRANDLKAQCLQGKADKIEAVEEVLKEKGFGWDEVLFIGNDIQDIAMAKKVGFSAAPANVVAELRDHVDYVATANGGHGAVREILQMMLSAKGLWDGIVSRERTLG